MSSIAGFFHSNQNFQEHPRLYRPCLEKMNDVQKHRGSADSSIYLDVHCGRSISLFLPQKRQTICRYAGWYFIQF